MGKHIDELTEYEITVQAKMVILGGTIPWLLSCVFCKLSILCFYNRIFTVKVFLRWSRGLIVAVICYCIAFFAVYMTNCQPIYNLWHPVEWGHCREMSISDFATLGTNITLDIAIIILPMPVLWNLKMPLRNKISISIMFSIGFVTIGVMCWRIAAAARTRSNPDYTYNFPLTAVLSFCELWLGIIVACIPTLAPLLNAYIKPAFKRFTSTFTNTNKSTRGSNCEMMHFDDIGGVDRSGGKYCELEDGSDDRILRSNPALGIAITTECAYEPPRGAPFAASNASAIHVQHQREVKFDAARE
ncbi:hypothetical protein Hte_011773 [Hypoxylon texense]